MLAIRQLTTIKPHVFYLETNNKEELILKKHHKQENVRQQWDFFQKLPSSNAVRFIRFPNGKKAIFGYDTWWTIAPYVSGKKLYYKNAVDRTEAVKALKHFHHDAVSINITSPLKRENMLICWYWRLLAFKKTKDLFKENGFAHLYKDIVQMTSAQLKSATQFPWERYEEEALKNGLWTHGDVASHNFIRGKGTYLIDFDLLQSTAQIYDHIQLAQRFLPHLNWDLEKLLAYDMVKNKEVKPWLYAVFIPSDLMREWFYFMSGAKREPSDVNKYMTNMEKEWQKRHDFLKNTKTMLKSI